MGTIRDRILTPENVANAIDRAVEIIRSKIQPSDRGAMKSKLGELETQIERPVDLAAETGGTESQRPSTGIC